MQRNYKKDHCWQYDRKLKTLDEDLKTLKINSSKLKTKDFIFSYVDKVHKGQCNEIIDFIKRYEWLGTMPIWLTHRFVAKEKKTQILSGVVIMATPNAFSNILGKEYKNKEKLIARGASVSWAPKNLASWQIMKSIKWMVDNTEFRIFSAYSDPEAKELGTIYQACNFYYIGQTFGTGYRYFDPDNLDKGWFNEAYFNYRSTIIKYSKELGINWIWWKTSASGKYRKLDWSSVPKDVIKNISEKRKEHKNRCKKEKLQPKHKYIYILGKDKKETKMLRRRFKELNSDKANLSYPKERGK